MVEEPVVTTGTASKKQVGNAIFEWLMEKRNEISNKASRARPDDAVVMQNNRNLEEAIDTGGQQSTSKRFAADENTLQLQAQLKRNNLQLSVELKEHDKLAEIARQANLAVIDFRDHASNVVIPKDDDQVKAIKAQLEANVDQFLKNPLAFEGRLRKQYEMLPGEQPTPGTAGGKSSAAPGMGPK